MTTIVLLALSYLLHVQPAVARRDAPNPRPKDPHVPLMMR
jgi:hypothetical protein